MKSTTFIAKELHDQIVTEKDRVISLLEFQNQQLIPMADKNQSDVTVKINELKSIAENVIKELPSEKSSIGNDLISKLNQI